MVKVSRQRGTPKGSGGHLNVEPSGRAATTSQFAQGPLKGSPATVVQAVHRTFGLVQEAGDLGGGQSRDVAQHEHLALLGGQPVERLLQALPAIEADLLVPLVAGADLLERDLAPGAEVIQGGIARDSQDPGDCQFGRAAKLGLRRVSREAFRADFPSPPRGTQQRPSPRV